MCRFAFYLGEEIFISSLITTPVNSLVNQSSKAREREDPLNGAGFGLAWYPGDAVPPAAFKSTSPAWSNCNLREIARVTKTHCVLAHVRAASPGLPVTDLNCHPFVQGALSFMHNGEVGGFRAMRRKLLAGLSDEAFESISGSTDSEHAFAVFLDALAEQPEGADQTECLAAALQVTIGRLERLRQAVGTREPARLNFVVSDGERSVITRYASGDATANSLYYSVGRMYSCEEGLCRMRPGGSQPSSVLVVSEPLDESDAWVRVQPGTMVIVSPSLQVSERKIVLQK